MGTHETGLSLFQQLPFFRSLGAVDPCFNTLVHWASQREMGSSLLIPNCCDFFYAGVMRRYRAYKISSSVYFKTQPAVE